jgi:hypothetical protein
MASLTNISGVLKALNDPLGTVTVDGVARTSNNTTKDAGLYALIDDLISTLLTIKNNIKKNEKGIIAELAGDAGDTAIALNTSSPSNSITTAFTTTIGVTATTLAAMGNDTDYRCLSNALGATDRGRSVTLANNPAVLIGTKDNTIRYSESAIFALISEQRMLLKRLLAGALDNGLGDAVAERSNLVLTNADD